MKTLKSNAMKVSTRNTAKTMNAGFKSVSTKKLGSVGTKRGAPTSKIVNAPRKSSTGGLNHAMGSKKGV